MRLSVPAYTKSKEAVQEPTDRDQDLTSKPEVNGEEKLLRNLSSLMVKVMMMIMLWDVESALFGYSREKLSVVQNGFCRVFLFGYTSNAYQSEN